MADLAFGHCRRLRQKKTTEYCQSLPRNDVEMHDFEKTTEKPRQQFQILRRFKGVLSAAVKASETVDTLRSGLIMQG